MKVDEAYEKSMETVVRWIDNKINSNKTQVIFRTYAPVHFRYLSYLRYFGFPNYSHIHLNLLKLGVHWEALLLGIGD